MNEGLLIYNCSTVIHTIHEGINSTFFCCCIGLALCYTNTFFNVTCQKDSKCFYTCCCIGFQKQFLFLIYFFWFFFSFWKTGLSENVFFQLHLPTGFKMFLPLLLHWISKTIFVSYLLLLWLFFLFEKNRSFWKRIYDTIFIIYRKVLSIPLKSLPTTLCSFRSWYTWINYVLCVFYVELPFVFCLRLWSKLDSLDGWCMRTLYCVYW